MSNYNTHAFSVELATEIGLDEAILLQHFFYWHRANEDNPEMQRGGKVWCFSSRKSIMAYFPYFTERRIRTTLDKMVATGLLEKGDFNENKFVRTNWYCLTEKSLSLFGAKMTNRLAKMTKDWSNTPVNNNNINNKKKENIIKRKKYAEFVSMSEDEYAKLVSEWGEKGAKDLITILDNYKGSSGKNYKSDYRAILMWVTEKYEQNGGRKMTKSNSVSIDNIF